MADGDALREDRESPPRVPASPELHLDGFDGPLDLLLDLAERARIDLGRIPIGALIDQLVDALTRYETHVPIERRADWLVLATRLLVLRSRLLFAPTPEAAEQAEREAARELVRLRDLQAMKAAVAWLAARSLLGRDVFARPLRERDPRVASYLRLMEACLVILEREEATIAVQSLADAVYRPAARSLFRLQDALARMRARLATQAEPIPLTAFLPCLPADAPDREWPARSAVSSTFVAALELARSEEIRLTQDQPFDVIFVGPAAALAAGMH